MRPASVSHEASSLTIKDLWLHNSKAWNEPYIRSNFPDTVANKILSTPLNELVHDDHVVWKASDDGIYSVKTAYNLVLSSLVDCSRLGVEGDWS